MKQKCKTRSGNWISNPTYVLKICVNVKHSVLSISIQLSSNLCFPSIFGSNVLQKDYFEYLWSIPLIDRDGYIFRWRQDWSDVWLFNNVIVKSKSFFFKIMIQRVCKWRPWGEDDLAPGSVYGLSRIHILIIIIIVTSCP